MDLRAVGKSVPLDRLRYDAEVSGIQSLRLGPTRTKLISKGMICGPGNGDTAFTVPLFDEFMRRMMPGRED